MSETRPTYPAEFRQQMVDLVRASRDPIDLAREFESARQTIQNWIAEAESSEVLREVGQLKLERDIHSPATAWFARETGVLPSESSGS